MLLGAVMRVGECAGDACLRRRSAGGAAANARALPLVGGYLADSDVEKPSADAEDAALATRLWASSF